MTYKREPLEEDEIVTLRSACKTQQEEVIINVLLDTGFRVSEFASLTRENIAWQRGCINIVGKGGKRRVVPMSNLVRFY